MRLSTLVALFASLLLPVLAQQQASTDLTQLISKNPNLTEFSALLTSFGSLYANLSFQEGITIFAPSNDAFEKIPYQILGPAFESNNSDVVTAVLEYHVGRKQYNSGLFNSTFTFLPTWLSNDSFANVSGGQNVGVVEQAGDVFVAVSGMGSRSTLTSLDNTFSGGVMHVIDTFFIPPQPFSRTAPQFNVTSLSGAVIAAGLSDYVDNTPNITVFAPNNLALQNLGTSLATMTVSELSDLLKYHIVNSTTAMFPHIGYSSFLPNGTVLPTVEGGNLTITFADNSLFVNEARVLQQDLLLANGVMHVIDSVLDYNATGAKPNPALPTAAPILSGTALSANELPFTTFLPNTTSELFASSSPTGQSSSFAESDIGKATSSGANGAAASSTTTSAEATSTEKKSAGERLRAGAGAAIAGLFFSSVLFL